MKKSALLYSLVFAATASFTSFASAADYQSIRMLQTSEQFDRAIEADTVIVSLPQNLTLYRKKGAAEAKRTIQKVMAIRGDNGQVEKELVTSCELSMHTKQRKIALPNTLGKEGPWGVMSVTKLSNSKETWSLGRHSSERVSMTCESFERTGGVRTEITLTASMVNRTLSQVNGGVLTEVQPHELSKEPHNDVVAASGPTYSTPTSDAPVAH